MKILLTGIFCAFSFLGIAQINSGKTIIAGIIKDKKGDPVIGASVIISKTKIGAATDPNGYYIIKNTPKGTYEVVVKSLGFKTQTNSISIQNGNQLSLNFILEEDPKALNEVIVQGKTTARKIQESGFNVNAIEIKKLINTTTDINQLLNRTSGMRIRESGGLGSVFNFSMNGFTGNQVKFFLDGIPMDNFGTSLQINNIPINMADRIEIYKGVVPVWLGADALGGAVNIVTNPNKKNYLDVSYSYGSFNTHRTAINTGYTSKSGFTVQLNAFHNYSDNNYKVDVDVANLTTGVYTSMRVRRFHDKYRNETIITSIGVTEKRYADKLLLGITLGQNKADIQTGNRMFDVYGTRKRNGDIVMPSLKYLKNNLFAENLKLSVSANYNFGYEQLVDTLFRQYNWLGEYRNKSTNPNILGGELRRTLYKYKNNNASLVTNLSYKFAEKHSLVLNNTFTSFNRKGKDELDPENEQNKQARKNFKNVFGLGYQYNLNERFNASVFLKNYNQSTTGYQTHTWQDEITYIESTYYTRLKNSMNNTGYGAATSYLLVNNLRIKASYEKTYRLPENTELFGSPIIDLLPNFDLSPESSSNYNLGLVYQFPLGKMHKFHIESNMIYRNSKDFIRPTLTSYSGVSMLQMVNQRNVRTIGIDGETRYTYNDALTVGMNVSWQNIRNVTKYEDNSSTVSLIYKDRIPNMPYLYGNANAQYSLKGVGNANNILSIGYNLTYVHEYYLNWPSLGASNTKLIIPRQCQHDANAVYSLKNGTYNITLECRNLFDAKIYDNFSLQKPGRSFSIKLRYFIAGNHK